MKSSIIFSDLNLGLDWRLLFLLMKFFKFFKLLNTELKLSFFFLIAQKESFSLFLVFK